MVPARNTRNRTRKYSSTHVLSAAALAGALLVVPLATAAAAPGTVPTAFSQQATFTAPAPAGDPMIEEGSPADFYVNFREGISNMRTSYQWMSGGLAISGATDLYYTPTAADLAAGLSVEIRGEIHRNGIDAPDTGAWTVAIPAAGTLGAQTATGGITPATITTRPTLAGTAGMGRTVTVDPQGWAGYALSYEWICDGHGAGEAASYTATEACGAVSVTVRATSEYGSDQVTLTAEMAAVVKNLSAPTVTGGRMVGDTLTVDPGTWSAGTLMAYQWTRGGTEIPGATGPAYAQTPADAGSFIGVRVTGTHGDDVPLTMEPDGNGVSATQASALQLEKPPAPPKGDNLILDGGSVNGGVQPPPAPAVDEPSVKRGAKPVAVKPAVKQPVAKQEAKRQGVEKPAVLADGVEPVITTNALPPEEAGKPQPQAAVSLAPAAGMFGSFVGVLAALATGLAQLRKQ
ncbi:hypothetical protein B5P43_15805 [Bacillus sp. SRB_336]|nr:hypothetical protein B5P43_15805 [Bacillus sp. SRB_336]